MLYIYPAARTDEGESEFEKNHNHEHQALPQDGQNSLTALSRRQLPLSKKLLLPSQVDVDQSPWENIRGPLK